MFYHTTYLLLCLDQESLCLCTSQRDSLWKMSVVSATRVSIQNEPSSRPADFVFWPALHAQWDTYGEVLGVYSMLAKFKQAS
jgi:hypothetical protein